MKGLAAVRAKIEDEFKKVHGGNTLCKTSCETSCLTSEERANAYCNAALRAKHIAKQPARRTNVSGVWEIDEVKQTAEELIRAAEAAMKQR